MEQFRELPNITQFAIGLLIISGLYVHARRFNTKFALDGPAIFTTGGIFFTFWGIASGLLNFDVNNIEASLPALLAGLKTAFLASVVGVAIALTIKLRFAIFGVSARFREEEHHGTTVDDLFGQMVKVQEALVGDDDATLLSQLKLGRQDTNDRLDGLRRSQQEFMEKMAENNSKALIQALQEVIRDFNAKINEQFGDNFKRLNEAVEKILIWQERYRTQMQEMIEQQQSTARNMTVATERYESLVTSAERFSVVSDQLAKLLGALEIQRNYLEESLKSLVSLLNAAAGNLPQIERKIVDLTEQVTRGVKSNHDEISRALVDTSNRLKTSVSEIEKLMRDAFETANHDFNGHVSQIMARTKEQVQTLDSALDKELTRALDTLARQLTALSQKFVEDYTPLTTRLREVVNLAKAV